MVMKISKKIGLLMMLVGAMGMLLAGCGKVANEASSPTDSISVVSNRAVLGQLADKSFNSSGKSEPVAPSSSITGESIRVKSATLIDGEEWKGGYLYQTSNGPTIGTFNAKYYFRTATDASPYTTLTQYYTLDNELKYTMRSFWGDRSTNYSTSGLITKDNLGNIVEEQSQKNTRLPGYVLLSTHYRTPVFETEGETKYFEETPPRYSIKGTVYYGGKSSPYAVFRILYGDSSRMEFTVDSKLNGTNYTYEGVFLLNTDLERRMPSCDLYRYPKKAGDMPVAKLAIREDSRIKVYMYKPDGTLESSPITPFLSSSRR